MPSDIPAFMDTILGGLGGGSPSRGPHRQMGESVDIYIIIENITIYL